MIIRGCENALFLFINIGVVKQKSYNSHMKNLFKAIALSLFIILPLTSCDLFEKSGNIENYIGSYTLDAANERTYHYYWGSKKLINEKDISDAPKRIIINNDKTVTFLR